MAGGGLLCLVLLVGMTACAAPPRMVIHSPPSEAPPTLGVVPARPAVVGTASWYGALHHGKRTASGEVFDMNALTAAHRTLPLGTRVRVTNLSNGKSVEVRVNDRGPGVFPVEVLVLE